MKPKTMNSFTIAMLYIGSLLGAGFVSGKEIYTYFGIYGDKGQWGIALCTFFFIVLGALLLQFAAWKRPDSYFDLLNMENKRFKVILEWCMLCIFTVIFMAMLAAGGAVFEQQFSVPTPVGSMATAIVVYMIVIRGVQGVVRTLGRIVPLVLILALGISIYLIAKTPQYSEVEMHLSTSATLFPWYTSSFIYLCYNFISAIPILCVAGIQSDSTKKSLLGGLIGGVGLGVAAFLLYQVILLDLSASDMYPVPMLYFLGEVSPTIQVIYAVALILAIFCAAVNSLYAITPQLPHELDRRRLVMFGICVACYTMSLIGFTNVVQYVYPLQGVIGFAIIILLTIGFVKEYLRRRY